MSRRPPYPPAAGVYATVLGDGDLGDSETAELPAETRWGGGRWNGSGAAGMQWDTTSIAS